MDLGSLGGLEVDAAARSAVAGVAVSGNAIEDAARKEGLRFPPLPSSADRCSLGGMLANNSAGARSFRYGAVRAWVEGVDVVLADGRFLDLDRESVDIEPFATLRRELTEEVGARMDTWPRVSKNSSGYALDRFLADGDPSQLLLGSEGTLCVFTGARLALALEPDDRAVVVLPLSSPVELIDGVRSGRAVNASAAEFFGDRFLAIADLSDLPAVDRLAKGAWGLLVLELEGSRDDVDAGVTELTRQAGPGRSHAARSPKERAAVWAVRHRASPRIAEMAGSRTSTQFVEDSVVPLAGLPDYLTGLDRILSDAKLDAVVFGHAGDGNVHVNPLVDFRDPLWRSQVTRVLEDVVDLVRDLGGTLSGEHGDGRVRAPFLERVWGATWTEAFRSVKKRLDPHETLNPGVVLPLPGQDPLDGMGQPRYPDEASDAGERA
jgi:FAD/FMN-containing dehydrogenase